MKYELVQWPESQHLMDHPRFNECLFIENLEGHDDVGSSAYACPEDIYNEIFPPYEPEPQSKPEPQKKPSLVSIFTGARKALMDAISNKMGEQCYLSLPDTVESYEKVGMCSFVGLCREGDIVFAEYFSKNENEEMEDTRYKDELELLSANELYDIAHVLGLIEDNEEENN